MLKGNFSIKEVNQDTKTLILVSDTGIEIKVEGFNALFIVKKK